MGSVFSFYITYKLRADVNPLQLCVRVLFRILYIFLVILMSGMDALPLDRWKKIILGAVGSMALTVLSITVTVQFYQELEQTIIISEDIVISTYTLRNSAYRIVAIFFWKQTIFSFLRKEKCILITYTPFIKWINPLDGANSPTSTASNCVDMVINSDTEPQHDHKDFKYPKSKASVSTEMREMDLNDHNKLGDITDNNIDETDREISPESNVEQSSIKV